MDERLRKAFEDGVAAALRGEEAAPGCTTTPAGHAFLDGYIEGRRRAAKTREDTMAKGDKVKGRIKEAAGDLIDDAELRRKGKLEQREADARDDLARAEEEAERKADEVADLERRT